MVEYAGYVVVGVARFTLRPSFNRCLSGTEVARKREEGTVGAFEEGTEEIGKSQEARRSRRIGSE
jgi:hypothetical protein